jgi:hypothetical protein
MNDETVETTSRNLRCHYDTLAVLHHRKETRWLRPSREDDSASDQMLRARLLGTTTGKSQQDQITVDFYHDM